ncbi:MAG: hypothetical protein WAJ93_19890 [Candidatus Nitrosopolaris sp.]
MRYIVILNYSGYLAEISKYERVEKLNEIERSAFFKIMNAYQPVSYLKLRRHREPYNKDEYNAIKRLQELNLVKVRNKKKTFMGRDISYVLTTYGLFYIFSNLVSYPPQLLTKYQYNIILNTLLSPYFEVDTMERSTARFYSVITQYLQECCRTTLHRIDTIGKYETVTGNNDIKDGERLAKILESDLQWHAKLAAFKLGIMYNQSNILVTVNSDDIANDSARVAMYELETTMKTILSKDKKFIHLLKMVHADFGHGFEELMEMKDKQY